MKVWREHKTKENFMPSCRTRFCWQVCYDCKEAWQDIDTQYVNMIYTTKTLYICDNCAKNDKYE